MKTGNTDDTKFCIMFEFDESSNAVIDLVSYSLAATFSSLFKPRERKGLPNHMTIIGGIKLPSDTADQVIRDAVGYLKPFSEKMRPKLIDIEPVQMLGNNLAIRLKFAKGKAGYVMTGDVKKNRALVTNLGSTQNLNTAHHITLGSVEGGMFQLDLATQRLEQMLEIAKPALLWMRFRPAVYYKSGEFAAWWSKYKI